MVKPMKVCLQWSLKFTNLTIGCLGTTMIFYGIWMIRVWQRDAEDSHFSPDYDHFPWYIHAFLGIGTALCAITCLGHVAAHTANYYCLSSYMFIIFVLLLSEGVMAADVLLNDEWEKDLPEDPSGRFDEFKEFVISNKDFFRWISLFSVLAQGCSMIFAITLRTIGKVKEYSHENEGEYSETWAPLLRPPELPPATMYPPYVIGEPVYKCVRVLEDKRLEPY